MIKRIIMLLAAVAFAIQSAAWAQPAHAQASNSLDVRMRIEQVEALSRFDSDSQADFYPIVSIDGHTEKRAVIANHDLVLPGDQWSFGVHYASSPYLRGSGTGGTITISLRERNRSCFIFCRTKDRPVDVAPSDDRTAIVGYFPSYCQVNHAYGGSTRGLWLTPDHCSIRLQTTGNDGGSAQVIYVIDLIWS